MYIKIRLNRNQIRKQSETYKPEEQNDLHYNEMQLYVSSGHYSQTFKLFTIYKTVYIVFISFRTVSHRPPASF